MISGVLLQYESGAEYFRAYWILKPEARHFSCEPLLPCTVANDGKCIYIDIYIDTHGEIYYIQHNHLIIISDVLILTCL